LCPDHWDGTDYHQLEQDDPQHMKALTVAAVECGKGAAAPLVVLAVAVLGLELDQGQG